jgi:D-glycero-D-manno-heptose 1,7-bisphosphate phosphatase
MKRAVFLDRDGTLIESVHYLACPDEVQLLPRTAAALRAWQRLGYLRVLVTNQAAVSKGLLSEQQLGRVHARLIALLAAQGASLDAIYYATEEQRGHDRLQVEHVNRKPGPGLLLRAAKEHDIDLRRSWMVGDALSDTMAGRNAGCCGSILVRATPSDSEEELHHSVDWVVSDVGEAVQRMADQLGAPPARSRPDSATDPLGEVPPRGPAPFNSRCRTSCRS